MARKISTECLVVLDFEVGCTYWTQRCSLEHHLLDEFRSNTVPTCSGLRD